MNTYNNVKIDYKIYFKICENIKNSMVLTINQLSNI